MAITVWTNDPRLLLSSVKKEIDDKHIITWSYDKDGDFTHTAEQWNRKAWLRPAIKEGKLVFRILTPKGKTLSRQIYGIYHGRFIEMLTIHVDDKFDRVTATALATLEDVVGST